MSHRRIIIETIDFDQRRYPTQGDWFYDADGNLIIQVISEEVLPNVKMDILAPENFLIALHELIEVMLCRANGITQEQVDEFDFAFKGDGEPGDQPDAPYRAQHRKAMIAEHLVADWLGVSGYGRVE